MSREDTNSIKYILEEMDPAEKVEFERMMASNPDLRIEVESMRRMNGKLDNLPDLDPPKHLTDSILSVAADQANRRQSFKSGYFLSAAVVILGLTTGSLILQGTFDENSDSGIEAATFSSFGSGMSQNEVTRTLNIQPWVDWQDVLRLNGFESLSSPKLINEAGNTMNKLRPVGKYPASELFGRPVQLTGNNR